MRAIGLEYLITFITFIIWFKSIMLQELPKGLIEWALTFWTIIIFLTRIM